MKQTPLPVIANVTRVVTRITDRITGDRSDFPLLVSAACSYALLKHGIESHILFGHAAWIEVLEDGSVLWAGCFDHENPHFWVETQFQETVDLTTSVAFKKKSKTKPQIRALYSPPLLWSTEVPAFYRYHAEGAAELDPQSERDQRWWKKICEEIDQHCKQTLSDADPEFPNEPLIGPNRSLLDDTEGTFKLFDEAISAQAVPKAPF